MTRTGLAAGITALLAAACARPQPPSPRVDAAVAPSPSPSGVDFDASGVDASPTGASEVCTPVAEPKTATSIGHTSVVFKVVLPDGKKAAWKPDADKRRGRYRGEIAAYRLGRALGLADNVPPACAQSFTTKGLTQAFLGDSRSMNLLVDEVVSDGPDVHGALIPWVEGLQLLALEKEPLRTEARGWLRAAPIPEDRRALARQLGDLVVFDYLTTNWDRYSGGNVGLDRTGKVVLFIDNDAAFMTAPPKASIAQSRALLEGTDRFSRALVTRLEALDEAALAAALGEENGHPLYPTDVVHALALRREEVLRAIAAKRKIHGDEATLFFP